MGRMKLYRTKEQLLAMQRVRAAKYYQRNKERLNDASMQRYWESKRNLQSN